LKPLAFALVPLEAALLLAAPDGRIATDTLARAALGGVILAIQPLLVAARGRTLRVGLAALGTAALVPALLLAITQSAAIPRVAFLNGMSYAHWDGERAHDDLLWLEQPLLRRWNPYLSQHRFRGRTFDAPKPADVRRVVALGGSSTWGFRLPEDSAEDWPTVLQAELSKLPGADDLGTVEVINAAWSGASGDRLFRFLRDTLMELQPDVIVLCLYYNDAFALSAGDEEAYYAAITRPDFQRTAWGDWFDARAVAAGRARLRALMDSMAPNRDDRPPTTQAAWDALDLDLAGASPPERFEEMLLRFADFAARHGLGLVLVKEPLQDDQPKLWKDEFYAVIDGVGQARDLPVVDPRAALEAASRSRLFLDEIHLTPRGHAVMAARLAPVVAAELRRRP
jgi:lysophospholipase L1-like esterase